VESHQSLLLERTIDSDIDNIYGIRYRALRSICAIESIENEKCSDEFDEQDHSVSYSLKKGNLVIGTIRPVIRTQCLGMKDIPVMTVNRDILFQALPESASYIEVSRFAVDPLYDDKYSRAGLVLLRSIIANAIYYGCDYIIAVINRRHLGFYTRYIKCDILAELDDCHGVDISGYLVYLDVKQNMKKLLEDVDILRLTAEDVDKLSYRI